jgi:porphobilinogen synthase
MSIPHSQPRPRRLRASSIIRDAVAETQLSSTQFIQPHFCLPRDSGNEAIESMPGIFRTGTKELLTAVRADLDLGIQKVLLFGLTTDAMKDELGSQSSSSGSAVTSAVQALKAEFGDDILVMTDVCLCAYTDHGHCGLLEDGKVLNDPSLAPLTAMAVAHADAGADVVAPSDMMDGRIGAMRRGLDAAGHCDVALLSYAVKYASAWYGPFRDAANSSPGQGDRKTYQMDPRNSREALREAALDEAEGADMLMVKPALSYLDVIQSVKTNTQLPVVAYNVSGEYSAVKAAADRGWLDEAQVVRETLTSISRAGADMTITYHAREALKNSWIDQ